MTDDTQRLKDDMEVSEHAGDSKVDHPAYYTQGIEAAEYIASHKMDFFTGNVVKYITRAGLKDPATKREDLLKARWYLDYLIEHTGEAEK